MSYTNPSWPWTQARSRRSKPWSGGITRPELVGDEEHIAEVLTELKDLGVEIGVDDFGRGQSSLSYLKRYPVDVLKIDRAVGTRPASPITCSCCWRPDGARPGLPSRQPSWEQPRAMLNPFAPRPHRLVA